LVGIGVLSTLSFEHNVTSPMAYYAIVHSAPHHKPADRSCRLGGGPALTRVTAGASLGRFISPLAESSIYLPPGGEAGQYAHLHRDVAEHQVVRHAKGEYGRGEWHTNTIEGYFSIFKRGMKGVYQHCGEQHLHRYLAEFDFRYSNRVAHCVNDTMRADKLLKGIVAKRLTYRSPRRAENVPLPG
jgi:hypothetical protein